MASRTFTAPDGTLWQAWSVTPGRHAEWPVHARQHLPAALSDGWLCFESSEEKRRLHPVPPGWEERGEDELWDFCASARPVPRRLRGLVTHR